MKTKKYGDETYAQLETYGDEDEKSEWSDYEDDSDDDGSWFKKGYDDADPYKEDSEDWEDDDKEY